jgi:hypothetical protein
MTGDGHNFSMMIDTKRKKHLRCESGSFICAYASSVDQADYTMNITCLNKVGMKEIIIMLII